MASSRWLDHARDLIAELRQDILHEQGDDDLVFHDQDTRHAHGYRPLSVQLHVPLQTRPSGLKSSCTMPEISRAQAMFDQPEAEAPALGLRDRRARRVLPSSASALAVGLERPAHMHRAGGVGKRAILAALVASS